MARDIGMTRQVLSREQAQQLVDQLTTELSLWEDE